ncbi:MAG: pyridoxal-phosphate dependent enzyme [Polyangiales bacterium]
MSSRERPWVFERWPTLQRSTPWIAIADGPTPVERCAAIESFTEHRQRGVDLWMKRDDLVCASYGGNKVRRYEFLFAQAKARGASALYTLGGLASTQSTATAVLGARLGFAVHLVLYNQPITEFAREALCINAEAGAAMRRSHNFVTAAARLAWELGRARKGEAFVIEPGASSALANLGYIDAMLELEAQVRAGECPRPDAIVVPAGSSGTLAAIALGCRLLRWDTRAIGVRIAPRIATNRVTIGHRVRATARLLIERAGVDPASLRGATWEVMQGFIGRGYGYPTPEAIEGVHAWKTLTGASGEVTYSGKQLAALRALVREPSLRGKTVLLWNTLSTPRPALSSDARRKVPAAFQSVFEGPTEI